MTETVGRVVGRIMEPASTDPALEEKWREEEERFALQQRVDRFRALRIPITDRDEQLVLDGKLRETKLVSSTRRWIESDKPLLIVSGTTGRGKTLAAASMLLRVGGTYRRPADLSGLFLAQFGDEFERRDELVRSDGLLVVDDIGTERDAEAFCAVLVELLDYRRQRGRRNMWITNLSRARFEKRYVDPRLRSRIAESGLWLIESGDDMRRQKP